MCNLVLNLILNILCTIKSFINFQKNENLRSNFDTLKANKSRMENIIVPNIRYCLKSRVFFLNMVRNNCYWMCGASNLRSK